MSRFADDDTLALIVKLQQQLAAEQAYSAKLREALGIVQSNPYFSDLCAEAQYSTEQALALPHDDTALREWGARLLRKLAKDVPYIDSGDLFVKADELVSGYWKPL